MDSESRETVDEVKRKVSHLTRTMHHNLQIALDRGESLESLQHSSSHLAAGSKAFSKQSQKVKSNLWWQDWKYTIAIATMVTLIVIGLWLIYQNWHRLLFLLTFK